MEKEKSFKKYRLDVIVIAAIIILSFSVLLFARLTREEGAFASVSVKGALVGEYPLTQNGTYSLNGGTNVLVIENGAAYLSYSSCPDHTCERHGKIRYAGEQIICLPNEVIITVKGNDGIDIIS